MFKPHQFTLHGFSHALVSAQTSISRVLAYLSIVWLVVVRPVAVDTSSPSPIPTTSASLPPPSPRSQHHAVRWLLFLHSVWRRLTIVTQLLIVVVHRRSY